MYYWDSYEGKKILIAMFFSSDLKTQGRGAKTPNVKID